MSSSRGYSNSKGSHSFSISRNSGGSRYSGGSRNGGCIPNGGRNPNSGGRNPNQMSCTLPVCGCKLPMRMYISNTFENPGRRFWCCRRWNNEDQHTCGLFIWDDELVPGMTPMMDDNDAMEVSKDEGCSKCSNIDEMLKKFDARECVHLKKKFEDERTGPD